MKLNMLWEYLERVEKAHKFYGDPLWDDKKDPVPFQAKENFTKTPKRKEDDMSFLIGGETDRNRFSKAMGTRKK